MKLFTLPKTILLGEVDLQLEEIDWFVTKMKAEKTKDIVENEEGLYKYIACTY